MKHLRLLRILIIWAVLTLTSTTVTGQTETASLAGSWMETEPNWDGTLRRIRVPILMYHYVSTLPENADSYRIDLTIAPDVFRAHIEHLFYEGYSTISMYQLHEALLAGSPLPPKPIVLTFDDGYIDHYTTVYPLLQQFGYTGTFFIVTSFADARNPNHLSWEQIREMSDTGMSMEPHTKTHQTLQGRDYEFLVYEMLGSMESLAAYTGRQPHMFAYPVGQYDSATLAVGRTLPIWRAVTTQGGRFHTTDNRLELDRVRISGGMGVQGLASVLRDD